MLKLLLIDVGTPRLEFSEPIGIEILYGCIKNKKPDVEVDLASFELQGIDFIENLILIKQFDVIGISTKIRSYKIFEDLIEKIEKISKKSKILIGDILGTYAFLDIVKLFPNVICVIGEGEKVIIDILDVLNSYPEDFREYLLQVPNLCFFYKNQFVTTGRDSYVIDHDIYPVRKFLPSIRKRKGITHVEASRGCINSSCAFCGVNQKYNFTKWRPYKTEHIIKDLVCLSNNGIKSPYFTDEDFFGNDTARVINLCDTIIKLKSEDYIDPDLNFYFNARLESILGYGYGGISKARSLLTLLKNAGLREVFIGFESGCSDQISRYNKKTTYYKSLQATKLLQSVGIDLDVGFIFFDPNSTLDELRINIDFIEKLKINMNHSRLVKRLRLQPYTVLGDSYAQIKKHNLNLNLVCYEYDFVDERVAGVYSIFSKWEEQDLDFIYNLQSCCRGEVLSEEDRTDMRMIIGCYRDVDLKFLNGLIYLFINSDEKKIPQLISNFQLKRENLDMLYEEKIVEFDRVYRN